MTTIDNDEGGELHSADRTVVEITSKGDWVWTAKLTDAQLTRLTEFADQLSDATEELPPTNQDNDIEGVGEVLESLKTGLFKMSVDYKTNEVGMVSPHFNMPDEKALIQEALQAINAIIERGVKTIGYRLDDRIDFTQNDISWEVIDQYINELRSK